MTRTTAASRLPIVADICLYGTRHTGAGYLAQVSDGRPLFGTGEPVEGRTFSEAIWRATDEVRASLRADGTLAGRVRIFDAGGARYAVVGLYEACIYGALAWATAPAYVVDVAALVAASVCEHGYAQGCRGCDPDGGR